MGGDSSEQDKYLADRNWGGEKNIFKRVAIGYIWLRIGTSGSRL